MEDDRTRAETTRGDSAVQEFLALLRENSPGRGLEYAMLLAHVDGMARQLDTALKELGEVKAQLAGMQEDAAKQYAIRAADAAGSRYTAMRERIADIKSRITEGAREAVEGIKHTGVEALDKAVSVLGIKKALEQMQRDLGESLADVKKSIGKMETIGHELRSAGGHVRNAGRAAGGKELMQTDGGTAGRFQEAVLSPLRLEEKILTRLRNMALAALGNVERLEQAAGRTGEEKVPDAGENGQPEVRDSPEDPKPPSEKMPEKMPEKGKEKPSLLGELKEGKARAAACSLPAPDKNRKTQEAAL